MTFTATDRDLIQRYWRSMFTLGMEIERRGRQWSTWVIEPDDTPPPPPSGGARERT